MSRPRRGFSLVELLVAIGIIAILIALLMPVLSKVRKAAQTTRCLANLHQWGASYQMYLNGNHGKSLPAQSDLTDFTWYERLMPYNGRSGATLLCPAATDPGNAIGSASQAWGPVHTWAVASPNWTVRASFVGSYGFNAWLFDDRNQELPDAWRDRMIRLPASDADRVPVLGDCAEEWAQPRDTDAPGDLQHPVPFASGIGPRPTPKPGDNAVGMRLYCMDRHEMAINVLFLDGHAERIPLSGLWKLKWNHQFVARDVTIR